MTEEQMVGPDPAFAASPSSHDVSRPSGLQSGVGFTPGPWSLSKAVIAPRVNGPDREFIATIHRDMPQGVANARLIVRAPEMFEALQRIITAHDAEAGVEYAAALANARNALAKAGGGA